MQKRLQQWKEQKLNKKKDNDKGAAMVLVITTIAVIGILVVTLLSVTMITLRMKVTQMRSQKNFYNAESALDDINVGLQKRVADAAGAAYTFTLEHYSDADAATRQSNFMSLFEKELLKNNPPSGQSLVDNAHSTMYAKLYDKTTLQGMVSAEVQNAAKTCQVDAAGGANGNVLNLDSTAGTYTFKNVVVTYINQEDYMSVIQTDIVVTCPPIDFNQTATSPLDLTSFILVANEQSQISGGDINIAGSAYLGTDDESTSRCAADYRTGTVTFESIGDNTRLITGGTMYASQGADVVIKGPCTTWAKNVDVDDAAVSLGVAGTNSDGTSVPAGVTYLSNDISMGNSSRVTAGGELIAYGTLTNAIGTYGSAAVDSNPAAYSSAILINGKNTTLDLNGLDSFIIAGNAYVNAERNSIAQSVNRLGENKNVPMGESIAMKSDQRAYMVPAKFIAPFCASGGVNPMLGTKYQQLEQELADTFYGGDRTKVQSLDFLRASATSPQGVPADLAQYGVKGIQKEVYPMNSGTQMVYFFLIFDSQKDVNEFAESYFAQEKNLSALRGRVATNRYNTNINYPTVFKDKENELTDYTFYYNGCVIVPDGVNTRVLSGKLSYMTSEYSVRLQEETVNHQLSFAALRHKLVAGPVSQEELNRSVYDNIVLPMVSADPKKNIPSGSKKVFELHAGGGVAPEAAMCAVVVNNRGGSTYVVGNPTNDAKREATEQCGSERLPVHVVIASGDVEVRCNFNGMIIAGGRIIIDNQNKSLKADSNLTQQALRIEDSNGIRAVDYLVAGESCLSGGAGGASGEESGVAFSEYVTYSNWTKR